MNEMNKDETIAQQMAGAQAMGGAQAPYQGAQAQQPTPEPMAVRVYERPSAQTEFPVLKAFQEYLEAEQAKAHKRMLALSVFFIILLVIVVLTFTIITSNMISRNQQLEDRLMDMAQVNRTAPAAAVQKQADDKEAAAKKAEEEKATQAILAKLAGLESELTRAREAAEANKAALEAAQAQAAEQAAAAAQAKADAEKLKKNPPKPAVDPAVTQRQIEALKKQQEELQAAREKLKAEQEALRKEQVEQQRRRLYPEFYAREDARKAAEEAAKNPPPALPSDKAPLPADPAAKPAKVAEKPAVQVQPPVAPAPATPEAAHVNDKLETPATQPKAGDALQLQKILDEDDAPVKAKAEPPKKSALQAILEDDDAPKTTKEKSEMTDEEQKKIESDLRNLLESLDAVEKGKEDASPAPAAAKTETLNVGGKGGKAIPWLVEIPGETPVEDKKDDDAVAPAK